MQFLIPTTTVHVSASVFGLLATAIGSSEPLISDAGKISPTPQLLDQAVIALVGGFIGFLFSFLLEYMKKRREPRKELSYESWVKNSTPPVDDSIRKRVTLAFDGAKVEELYLIGFDVTNTGNKVIKGQFIRFVFSDQVSLIETFLDPVPDPQWQVQKDAGWKSGPHETRYSIGQLECGQRVAIRFILSGSGSPGLTPYPKNDDGDVAFVAKGTARNSDDLARLTTFLYLAALLLLIPRLFDAVPGRAGQLAGAVASVAIIVPMLFFLGSSVRVVKNLAAKLLSGGDHADQIDVRGDNNRLTIVEGTLTSYETHMMSEGVRRQESSQTIAPDANKS